MDAVFLRVYRDTKHTLVAVCDCRLLGQTFRQGKLKLEVKTDFYKGVRATVPDALQAIDNSDIANLVGEEIVDAAVQKGFVNPSAIVHIGGVPHVQIVRM